MSDTTIADIVIFLTVIANIILARVTHNKVLSVKDNIEKTEEKVQNVSDKVEENGKS